MRPMVSDAWDAMRVTSTYLQATSRMPWDAMAGPAPRTGQRPDMLAHKLTATLPRCVFVQHRRSNPNGWSKLVSRRPLQKNKPRFGMPPHRVLHDVKFAQAGGTLVGLGRSSSSRKLFRAALTHPSIKQMATSLQTWNECCTYQSGRGDGASSFTRCLHNPCGQCLSPGRGCRC